MDILIIVILICVLFSASFKMGKHFLLTLTLALYPTLLIFQHLPYVSLESGLPQAIGFIVIYFGTISVLWKNIRSRKLYSPVRKIIDYGLLTLSYVILVISISTESVPSLGNLYTFSGIIPDFVAKLDFGLVLIIPLIVILLTNKRDNSR